MHEKLILSIHPRKQHNFEQASVLSEVFKNNFKHITTFYFDYKLINLASKFFPAIAQFMGRRNYRFLPKSNVITLPFSEAKRIIAAKTGFYYSPYMQNDDFQKEVIKKIPPPHLCISYDSASYRLFESWKGKTFLVLDLTIALPQYMLYTEHKESFSSAMLEDTDEFSRRLYTMYFKEIELADIILCGSKFVQDSIAFFKPNLVHKCRILPYGTELSQFGYQERTFEYKEAIKYVAVGTVDHRKGSDNLIAAWRNFIALYPKCELHFFGAVNAGEIQTDKLPANVFLHGRVDRANLIKQLKQMDVFVLPTLHEGSSLAIYQAMAMKLPIITTANSGTVLIHEDSCEIINAGDIDSLLNGIIKLKLNLEYRSKLAHNAFILSQHYTWEHYKDRLLTILNEII